MSFISLVMPHEDIFQFAIYAVKTQTSVYKGKLKTQCQCLYCVTTLHLEEVGLLMRVYF